MERDCKREKRVKNWGEINMKQKEWGETVRERREEKNWGEREEMKETEARQILSQTNGTRL